MRKSNFPDEYFDPIILEFISSGNNIFFYINPYEIRPGKIVELNTIESDSFEAKMI